MILYDILIIRYYKPIIYLFVIQFKLKDNNIINFLIDYNQ